mmetsp:Transcript_11077/g.24691  ORF Transcript_11077/g.24691 Transcript_11077/m.24691 type:complete len:560 (-) Transcript_11077:59-1738(-)
MVVWGGLRPIAARIVFDVVAVIGLSYSTFSSVENDKSTSEADESNGLKKKKKEKKADHTNHWNGLVLVASLVVTVLTAGNFTNRWTLTFPMVPIFILQGLRRIPVLERNRWTRGIICILSGLFILLGIKLSILFPAVELPPVEGPFHVGTVDLHIPVTNKVTMELGGNFTHLPIRILYPTLEKPNPVPYLTPATAIEYCRETMKLGAPDPIQNFGWMLHTWRLTHIQAKEQAQLIPPNGDTTTSSTGSTPKFQKLPVIIYSHGLGGTADIYSFQTLSLAAKGNIVVVMNHLDGTGPIAKTKSGQAVIFDHDISKMNTTIGDQMRRQQTKIRVNELLIVTEAVLEMTSRDTEEVVEAGLTFRGRLERNHVTVMGHSFGAATAFTAVHRRPDLYEAIVAHEPATLWMPIEVRKAYFAKGRMGEFDPKELVDGLFPDDSDEEEGDDKSSSDDAFPAIDTLLLFSHEWREKQWGHSHLFEAMHREGLVGPKDGVGHFAVIAEAHHNEFSDTCMLTPTWLGRSVGATGSRNPLETAREIHERTVAFLAETRARHDIVLPQSGTK